MYNKWTVCLGLPCRSACAVSNTLRLPGDVPPDANLTGIAVRLDRPLNDTTRQQILDAANTIASFSGRFEGDQTMSGEDLERSLAMMTYTLCLPDTSTILSNEYFLASESLTSLVSSATEETTDDTILPPPPSSPTIVQNYYNFYGSIYSPHSNVHGPTAQVGGDRNSGC